MNTKKKTVLITGGGSGIGLALAKKFLASKDNVIITGRNLAKLERVKADFPALTIMQGDATRDEDVIALVNQVQAKFGGVDVLINNAGIMNLVDAGSETNDLQKQLQEIEINYQGPVRMLHYFLPQLKKSENAVLINVSSGLAYVPFSQAPVYSGTKAAVHSWTEAIRPQLKPHGIRVVELLPPVVATDLAKEADLTDDNLKPMPTERLADIFWKEYTNGKDTITPGISTQLKFMSRLAPGFIFRQLNNEPIPKS